MLIDKISEEYPEIAMQAPLYHINQLLLKRTMENFQMRKLLEFSVMFLRKTL
jgi:hypothetical protein